MTFLKPFLLLTFGQLKQHMKCLNFLSLPQNISKFCSYEKDYFSQYYGFSIRFNGRYPLYVLQGRGREPGTRNHAICR